jgi:hypothetical protein
MKIQLSSFDIGLCNFAQYVEQIDVDKILNLEKRYKRLPKNKQRRVGGKMCPEIEQILKEVSLAGKRIQTGVYDFTGEGVTELNLAVRKNFLKHLYDYIYLWDNTDIFIIEQQFFNTPSFGKKRGPTRGKSSSGNVDAIKMAEALYMWLLDRYPNKVICYFSSQFKTQILGAPFKLNKNQRKQWATEKAKEIYQSRTDVDMSNIYELSEAVKRKQFKTEERITEYKERYECESKDTKELANKVIREKQKLDDVSDAFIQAQAFKYKTMVACF